MMGMTLAGFYNWDNSLLTDLDLPEGIENDQVIDVIMERSGDLFPYYQAFDPLKKNIHNWFAQNKTNFARILAAIESEYNPIENYDRYEDRTQEHSETGDNSSVVSENGTQANNGTSSTTGNSNTSGSAGNTVLNQRAADNSETFRNVTQEINSGNTSGYEASTTSGEQYSTASNQRNTQTTDTNVVSGDLSESVHIHGNIGVTTAQQMISAELDLRRYNLYEDIAIRFEDHFLIRVY